MSAVGVVVVAVPGYRIVPRAVEIHQHGVERLARDLLDAVTEPRDDRRECTGGMNDSRVGVRERAVISHAAGDRDGATSNGDRVVLPGDLDAQPLEETPGLAGLDPARQPAEHVGKL